MAILTRLSKIVNLYKFQQISTDIFNIYPKIHV